jgi:hypothetical protein
MHTQAWTRCLTKNNVFRRDKMSQNGKKEHKKLKAEMSVAARNKQEICHRWTKCHRPGKRGWTGCHKQQNVYHVTGVDENHRSSEQVLEGLWNEMSQSTKCPVNVPFGSKCSADVAWVNLPLRHLWLIVQTNPMVLKYFDLSSDIYCTTVLRLLKCSTHHVTLIPIFVSPNYIKEN